MKKIWNVINAILMIAVFVGNYFYLTVGGITIKSLCSSGFALMGILNLVYALLNKETNFRYHITMSVGLVLAMLGDILLHWSFVWGAGLFALGHICFLVSYCLLIKPKRLDFIFGGAIFVAAGAFLLFFPLLDFSEPYKRWVCFVYALIISMMLGKALSNVIRHPNDVTVTVAVGSVLFFFSDLMLVLDMFIGRWSWTGDACMATYYPAECLLALSIYVLSRMKEKERKKN